MKQSGVNSGFFSRLTYRIGAITEPAIKTGHVTETSNEGYRKMKGFIIVTTILATAAALGACRKHFDRNNVPMKLGSADTGVELPVRAS